MASIEGSSEIAEPLRTQILDVYRQTLEHISAAETWATKITEYQKKQADAPADLDAAQQELDEVVNAPAVALHLADSTTLEDLSQKIAAAESELRQKRTAAGKLDTEAQNRAERGQAIPGLLANASQQLEALGAASAGNAEAGVAPQLVIAQRCLAMARRAAWELEISAYQEESACYKARGEVLDSKRNKARLEVNQAQARVDALRAAENELRAAEVRKQKQQTEEDLRNAPEEIQKQAAINAKVIAEREDISRQLSETPRKLEKLRGQKDRLGRWFDRLRKQADQDTSSDLLGPLMRNVRTELNNLRGLEREYRESKKAYARVQSRVYQARSYLLELSDIETAKRNILATLREADPQLRVAPLEPRLRELLENRLDLLEGLKPDYESYSSELLQLVELQGQLLDDTRAVREFVNRYSLWLPSTTVLFKPPAGTTWGSHWRTNMQALTRRAEALGRALVAETPLEIVSSARTQLLICALGAAVLCATTLVIWLALARLLRAAIHAMSVRVAKVQTDSFRLTLATLLYTLLLAAFWPALVWLVGWRMWAAVDVNDVAAYDMARTLAMGLFVGGFSLFFLSLVRQICRPSGLAESHFHWNAAALPVIRNNALWLLMLSMPGLFIIAASEAYPDGDWRDLLGRPVFLLLLAALTLFTWRVAHPERGAFADWLRQRSEGWLHQVRYPLFVLLLALPLVLAVATVVGYYYTGQQLALRVTYTLRLVFLVALLHALLRRAVFVAQRRMALEQARRKRAAATAARLADQEGGSADATPQAEDEELDLVSIGEQTRKLLRSVAWFILAIGLWLSWSELLPALSFLGEIKLWAYTVAETGSQNVSGGAIEAVTHAVKYITLGNVVAAALVAVATFVLARNIPGLLEITLLKRLPLDTGGRFAITAVSRYVITVAGVVVAFGEIGVGWSKVQWLIAAMTVGLGFGLQEIFANFVSGLMLLFERPIRIGDTVTIGDISGTVSRIRIRATTITGWDRKELVIPNKEFITGKVVNWTLSDSTLRIIIPIGIAYGADTELAEQLLYKVAHEHENVLADPAPRVFFVGFGESALNFELRVFVAAVDLSMTTQHDLNKAIDREFRQAKLEIAFPQRDIHVRTIQQALSLSQARDLNPGLETEAT